MKKAGVVKCWWNWHQAAPQKMWLTSKMIKSSTIIISSLALRLSLNPDSDEMNDKLTYMSAIFFSKDWSREADLLLSTTVRIQDQPFHSPRSSVRVLEWFLLDSSWPGNAILPPFYKQLLFSDPKSAKRRSSLQCLFAPLGSRFVKTARKALVKLTLINDFTNIFRTAFFVWKGLCCFFSIYSLCL